MSYEATRGAWAFIRNHSDEFSTYEAMVLLALADRLNVKTGQLNPSIKRIAEDCRCSQARVKRAIARLLDIGVLVRVSGGGSKTNAYMLLIHTPATTAPGHHSTGSQESHPLATTEPGGGAVGATNQEVIKKEAALGDVAHPTGDDASGRPHLAVVVDDFSDEQRKLNLERLQAIRIGMAERRAQ